MRDCGIDYDLVVADRMKLKKLRGVGNSCGCLWSVFVFEM